MQRLALIGPLTLPDAVALGVTVAVWLLVGWFIEHPPRHRPSVSVLMQEYRREWMRQFVTRQPRIFDATMIDNLRQSTAFFASASMIAIGGGVALIGNPSTLASMASNFPLPADVSLLRLRALLTVVFLANALLKFIWSHRLFGYCAIMMAAVPNDPTDPLAPHRATQAGDLNITAAKSFNRGLRSIYFALGSLAWLLGAYALILAAILTAVVLIRREFGSTSRDVMLRVG